MNVASISVPAAASKQASSFLVLILLTVPLTALSIVSTGFEFGVGNNMFHIPFVLSLDQQAAFRDDAFYQSLRNFTAGPFVLLRWISNEANVETVFFASHVLSRAGAILATLHLARTLGMGGWALAFIGFGFVTSPYVHGATPVGEHGLFISCFTHSELTWPCILAAFAESHRGRFRSAAAFTGICVLVNLFIGLWLAGALVAGMLFNGQDRKLAHAWQMFCIFALISLPMFAWIASALHSAQPAASFSFREYVRAYYPHHFLIESVPPKELAELVAVTATAVLCAVEISARRLQWEIAGLAAIFIAGIPLPYLLDHRLIFNLHLLRVDGVIEILFVLLTLIVAWRRVSQPHWLAQATGVVLVATIFNDMSAFCALTALLAPRLVASFGSWRAALFIAASAPVLDLLVGKNASASLQYVTAGFILLAAHADPAQARTYWRLIMVAILAASSLAAAQILGAGKLRYITLVLCWTFAVAQLLPALSRKNILLPLAGLYCAAQCAGIAIRLNEVAAKRRAESAELADYRRLTDWLRSQEGWGPLLAPMEANPRPAGPWMPSAFNLQLHAGQPVWVDWKRGAAVMWQPSYHEIWAHRYAAVKGLRTPQEFHSYAVLHRLRWMLLPPDSANAACPGTNASPLFAAGRYRVCAV
jgi:hypothetical protein